MNFVHVNNSNTTVLIRKHIGENNVIYNIFQQLLIHDLTAPYKVFLLVVLLFSKSAELSYETQNMHMENLKFHTKQIAVKIRI